MIHVGTLLGFAVLSVMLASIAMVSIRIVQGYLVIRVLLVRERSCIIREVVESTTQRSKKDAIGQNRLAHMLESVRGGMRRNTPARF